jgi:hypothetical protein
MSEEHGTVLLLILLILLGEGADTSGPGGDGLVSDWTHEIELDDIGHPGI